ncbi:NADH:flavin oxidoreductase/NADH oxidase [Plectosphaerella plurivora]|uniref:NADH:flavin oxidoreductase/NADH oxidase n=1 Tax=Plectosphaerella plurivora TaxID=936078 RepID=A0A9P8VB07_9PEZI|nr:NADH:flavin oxidoreductase/NADH oxidase [Plectosphaerella plurivora]
MAPMTRNRGVPLQGVDRTWIPDELVVLYYGQRASRGGLIVTEGIPPSLEASGMPHVPGLFHEAQAQGWKKVVQAVHDKGGCIYAQLWHAGRATIPHVTGQEVVSASATAWETDEKFPFRTSEGEKVAYRDFPPTAMTETHMANTIADFVKAAQLALEIGFDGVELNGGNGNLIDQFLHSNINVRRDDYGGSPEARCKFPLDLVAAVVSAIGAYNVAIRLEPACLYQGTFGTERVETWSYLCEKLASTYAGSEKLSYVHFIEPRTDRIEADKSGFRDSWRLPDISNQPFRAILSQKGIPCISCGGWDADNLTDAVQAGWDAVVFARWFVSNPDLPERLRLGKPLHQFDRSRFYGSWDGVREKGYVDYPTWPVEETGSQ